MLYTRDHLIVFSFLAVGLDEYLICYVRATAELRIVDTSAPTLLLMTMTTDVDWN